jgi:hypothetical protein
MPVPTALASTEKIAAIALMNINLLIDDGHDLDVPYKIAVMTAHISKAPPNCPN